jgi:2,6-dihydroxypseudooxynicotine hydrolase
MLHRLQGHYQEIQPTHGEGDDEVTSRADTSSFEAFKASLGITGPVTTQPGSVVTGLPPSLIDLGLRLLGLGPFVTREVRSILTNLGIPADDIDRGASAIRRRSDWMPVWLGLAEKHVAQAKSLTSARDAAKQQLRIAIALQRLAATGDGTYFYPLPSDRPGLSRTIRETYARYLALDETPHQRVVIPYRDASVAALLHAPSIETRRAPGLLLIHGLSTDKEDIDLVGEAFRRVGFVTVAIDLPAHGESMDGPRIQADDEMAAIAALDLFTSRREVNPDRLAVLGGSLGAYFALRTAAIDRRLKACVALSGPYDVSRFFGLASPGIQSDFAWATGARDEAELRALAMNFHVRDALDKIVCPVFLGHGTLDHTVPFRDAYDIAAGIRAPLTVHPYVGADHEVALPLSEALIAPIVAWVRKVV